MAPNRVSGRTGRKAEPASEVTLKYCATGVMTRIGWLRTRAVAKGLWLEEVRGCGAGVRMERRQAV